MNAVVMDEVIVEDECIVGALSFVKKGHYPKRSIIAGNPAKVVSQVSDQMLAWKTKGTQLYQALPKDCHDTLKVVAPLTEIPANRPQQEKVYDVWKRDS